MPIADDKHPMSGLNNSNNSDNKNIKENKESGNDSPLKPRLFSFSSPLSPKLRSASTTQLPSLVDTLSRRGSTLSLMTAPLSPTSANTLIGMANSRRISLLQDQLDQHTAELDGLRNQIAHQRHLIMRLYALGYQLRHHLREQLRSNQRLRAVIRVVAINLSIIKMRLHKDKAVREASFRIADFWHAKGKLVKWIAWLLLCNAILNACQVYEMEKLVIGMVASPWTSTKTVRRIQSGTGVVTLMGTSLLLKGIWNEFLSSMPSPLTTPLTWFYQ